MIDGQNGTGASLTVDAAKSVFEGMLSDAEDTQGPETPSATETPEAPVESEVESDDTPDTDESEPSEEEQEEPAATPATYRVKIDGEEVEVTVDELLKGYSRTSDYTRKTQALAEQRKAAETELASVRTEREQYATYLSQLAEALQSQTPDEPDWATLQRGDPAEFAATWAAWQQHKERVDAVGAERERAMAQVIADQRTAFAKTIDAERTKLVDAIPAWSDTETAKREKTELREFAKSLGYTDADIAQVYDHRLMVLLRKAMLHERAEKSKPIVQQRIDKVKAATPGPGTKPAVTATTRAKQALAKTGRVDDAARVFLQMLD